MRATHIVWAAVLLGCGARTPLDEDFDAGSMSIDAGRDAGVDAAICAAPLERCDAAHGCCAGSECIDPCGTGGLCSVPGRDACGCGAFLDLCDGPGLSCLFTFCDAPGICVTDDERRRLCAGDLPACFVCEECGGTICGGPPPPECIGPHRARRYTTFNGCDETGECLYASETFECPDGGACVGGACEARCDCPAGTVCCDPGLCDPGAPMRCEPDPSPCIEPVAALGCDGRTYGTICGAFDAGVCGNDCDVLRPEVLGHHPCPIAPVRELTVLRDPDAWAAFFECAIPFAAPDFRTRDAIVACYDCACASEVTLESVRDCGDHAVVDFHYPELCFECEACFPSCIVASVPRLPPSAIANFTIADCGGVCCGG